MDSLKCQTSPVPRQSRGISHSWLRVGVALAWRKYVSEFFVKILNWFLFRDFSAGLPCGCCFLDGHLLPACFLADGRGRSGGVSRFLADNLRSCRCRERFFDSALRYGRLLFACCWTRIDNLRRGLSCGCLAEEKEGDCAEHKQGKADPNGNGSDPRYCLSRRCGLHWIFIPDLTRGGGTVVSWRSRSGMRV